MKSFIAICFFLITCVLYRVDFTESKEFPECKGTYLKCPEDCSKFYLCLRGRLFKLPCSKGLHFNEKRKTCDLPANAKCVPMSHKNEQPKVEIVTESATEAVTEPPTEPVTPATEPITEPATEKPKSIPTTRNSPPIAPNNPDLKVVCYCEYTTLELSSFSI